MIISCEFRPRFIIRKTKSSSRPEKFRRMCQEAGVSCLKSTLHKVISKLAVTIILLCKCAVMGDELDRGGGCVKPENCLGRKKL
jgi:hypothetical protein